MINNKNQTYYIWKLSTNWLFPGKIDDYLLFEKIKLKFALKYLCKFRAYICLDFLWFLRSRLSPRSIDYFSTTCWKFKRLRSERLKIQKNSIRPLCVSSWRSVGTKCPTQTELEVCFYLIFLFGLLNQNTVRDSFLQQQKVKNHEKGSMRKTGLFCKIKGHSQIQVITHWFQIKL